MSTPASTAASRDGQSLSIRGLVARHKMGSAAVALVIALMLAMIILPLFGSKAGAVSDGTSCTQWGSANQGKQAAYARLYIREHGALPGGGTSAASVITAINDGCAQAYGDGVSDTVNVVQAISGKF